MDWAGREQRGCSPEGSQRKASGKRWPAVVVSWQTQCCCPRWWQTGLWQPHWGRKWWPILPGYGDKKRLLEGWEWAQKWETGVGTRGHFYYNRKEIIFISHFFFGFLRKCKHFASVFMTKHQPSKASCFWHSPDCCEIFNDLVWRNEISWSYEADIYKWHFQSVNIPTRPPKNTLELSSVYIIGRDLIV